MTRDTTVDGGERTTGLSNGVLARTRWATRRLPAMRVRDRIGRTSQRRITRLVGRGSHERLRPSESRGSVWTDTLSYLVLAHLFGSRDATGSTRSVTTRSPRAVAESSARDRRTRVADGPRLVTHSVVRSTERVVSHADTQTRVGPGRLRAPQPPENQRERPTPPDRSAAAVPLTTTVRHVGSVDRSPTSVTRLRTIAGRPAWRPRTVRVSVRGPTGTSGPSTLGGRASDVSTLGDRLAETGHADRRAHTALAPSVVAETGEIEGESTPGRSTTTPATETGSRTGVGTVSRPTGRRAVSGPRSVPPLVVARSVANGGDGGTGVGATAGATSTEPAPTGGRPGSSSDGPESPATGRSQTGRSALGDDTSTSDTPRETPDVAFPPTAIDRIVDQLSDRLARDRRIARERGGAP